MRLDRWVSRDASLLNVQKSFHLLLTWHVRSQFGVRSFFPVLSFKSRAAITNKWNEWLANHWSHSPYHSISFKKFQIFVPPFNRLSKTDQKWFSHVSLPHKYIPHTLYCCFAYFIIPLFHGKKHNNLELTANTSHDYC